MLYGAKFTVFLRHMQNIYLHCGQNVEFWNAKTCGTYSNCQALKVKNNVFNLTLGPRCQVTAPAAHFPVSDKGMEQCGMMTDRK